MGRAAVPACVPTPRAAFALAVFLVLAGCAGSGVQPPGDLTVTPAPVPTDGTPTPAYRLAPGLSEMGVVAPVVLSSAHAERLRSTVYHVRIEDRVERSDGTVTRRVLEGTFADRTVYHFRVSEGGAGTETAHARAFYADGEKLYERLVIDGEVRYYVPRERLFERAPLPPNPLGHPTQREELYVALVGSHPAYAGTRTVDGETFHRLTAAEPTDHDFLAAMEYVDSFSSYEFEALVSDTGLVRAYRVEYVATVDGERRRVVRTARWSGVGNATVPVPDWYETARARTGN